MPFVDFEVGEAVHNDDGDLVAWISAIGKPPVKWVELAVSDYVTVPAERMECARGQATLKETGRHDSSGQRILMASGADPQHVSSTVQALCDYVSEALAELKRDDSEVDWSQVQAECEQEARNSFKTAEELLDQRMEERKMLRQRYFAEKEKEDEGGTFSISTQKRKLEKGVIVDDDGDFVVEVLDLDVDSHDRWILLAISEYTVLPVKGLLWCCAEMTTMTETGLMHEEVKRILRIQSKDYTALVETINELIDYICSQLAALRDGITEEIMEKLQLVSEYEFEQEGCTETMEQLMERHIESHKQYLARYNAQREARKAKEASQQATASVRATD